MEPLDGGVAEPLLSLEVDLHTILHPVTLHVVLVHLKLKGRSLFLNNLQKQTNSPE